MVSAYIAIRRKNREQSISTRNQLLNAERASRSIDISNHDVNAVQALPKDIGDAAKKRIERIRRRYAEVIRSPVGFADIDRETERAEFEICHTLRLIMKHNKGKLPTQELRDLWEAFNCDKLE